MIQDTPIQPRIICGVFGFHKISGYTNIMANKQKKKRNKQYTGVDASADRPSITRVSAANRNKVSQWWFDNKRVARPVGITSAVVLVIMWLIYELIRIASGA